MARWTAALLLGIPVAFLAHGRAGLEWITFAGSALSLERRLRLRWNLRLRRTGEPLARMRARPLA